MWSDSTKRGIRKAKRVFKDQKPTGIWKSLSNARRHGVWHLLGWEPIAAMAGGWSGLSLFCRMQATNLDRCSQELRSLWGGDIAQPKQWAPHENKGRIPNRSISEQNTLRRSAFVQGCPNKNWSLPREETIGLTQTSLTSTFGSYVELFVGGTSTAQRTSLTTVGH